MRKESLWKNKYPWFILAAIFLMLVFLNAFYLENWLDSDMAAEMMFSRLLAREGHLFGTQNWFYSTEFRLLYTQLIMTPLFYITDNWHVIRAVTNIVFYGLMLASYFYFMKPLQIDRNKTVLCAAVLLLPFSETMMLHMQMGNTYLSHVIIVFLYFGLFLRVAEKKSKQIVWWICYIVLGIICGLSGVRYMLAIQAPLFLTAVLYLMKTDEFQKLRHECSMDNWRMLTKKVLSGKAFRYLRNSLAGVISCAAGYAINVVFVSRTYSFQTYESTNFIDIYQGVLLQRMQDAFGSLVMLFGYIPGKSVLSLRGVISMTAFLMIGLLTYVVVRTLKTKNPLHQFVVYFFLVSFILNTFVFVFTNSTLVPRYYITSVMFLIPITAIYFMEEKIPLDKILTAVILAGCLLLATAKTTLSMITTDKNEDRYGAISFLEEQGYHNGYATYWNGNITQELSNGQLKLANISDPEEFAFFKWSTEAAYYEPEFSKGKVFMLLTAEEARGFENCENLLKGEKIYDDGSFVVYGYEDGSVLASTAK